jgi:hypothetical protein
VADYRIYRLGTAVGRAVPKAIVAANDRQAVVVAQGMVKGDRQAEVWAGTRLVATVYNTFVTLEPVKARQV